MMQLVFYHYHYWYLLHYCLYISWVLNFVISQSPLSLQSSIFSISFLTITIIIIIIIIIIKHHSSMDSLYYEITCPHLPIKWSKVHKWKEHAIISTCINTKFRFSVYKETEMSLFSSFDFFSRNKQISRKFATFNILPLLLCCVLGAEFLQFYW